MRIRISAFFSLAFALVLPLALTAQVQPPALLSPSSLAGDWTGGINTGGQSLPIVFHLVAKDGILSATWDSPSQGALGLATKSVTLTGATLAIDIPLVKGGYSGTVSEDQGSIKGTWKQGGGSLPLDLKRGAVAGPRRPQTPVAPFPYKSLDLGLPGGAPGVTLSATLTIPEGTGPFPAVILVTGSGPEDRDETIFGHKPFLVIADYLARRGVAVLRYDDRGFASSTGDCSRATTLDFAADAEAALEWLSSRPEIDSSRVGIIGHSEGGIIAPIVAAREPKVRFLVLLAGPGLRGEEILYLQGAAIAKAGGASDKEIAEGRAVNAKLYAAALAPGGEAEAAARVKAVYEGYIKGDTILDESAKKAALERSAEIGDQLANPWMRAFLAMDPVPFLAKVSVPTLALNGGLDLQVPPSENIAAITKAFGDAGHAGLLATRVFPNLNHLFQNAKTGHPGEYAGIEETFAPEALKTMADWILARTSARK